MEHSKKRCNEIIKKQKPVRMLYCIIIVHIGTGTFTIIIWLSYYSGPLNICPLAVSEQTPCGNCLVSMPTQKWCAAFLKALKIHFSGREQYPQRFLRPKSLRVHWKTSCEVRIVFQFVLYQNCKDMLNTSCINSIFWLFL